MCGRYASTRTAGQLADWFDAEDDTGGSLTSARELAPTDPVPIVRRGPRDDTRSVATVRWGLLPPWVPDRRAAARMINARAETVRTTPAYRQPFARRRCLVPADGWFEWRRVPDRPKKLKYFLTSVDGSPLAFAGLYESGSERHPPTCTVVTTAALGHLTEVHDRMPLLLAEGRWAEWLDCEGPATDDLLSPPDADLLDTITLSPDEPTAGYLTPTLF
ncbi:MAG: SOS response-associated peptidase [Actinocatenispora sp.]